MSTKEFFSQLIRYMFFVISILGEFTLVVFFLVFDYYSFESADAFPGYSLAFGWVLAIISFLIGIGLFLFLLYAFILPESKKKGYFSENKNITNIGLLTVFIIFIQIILVAVTLFFYSPLARSVAYTFVIIILISCISPFMLYYVANLDPESEKIFSLSKVTPLRIKLTTIWLLFLTGVIQIFSTNWTFLVVGLFILLASYFLFFLTRYAIVLTPIVLIIHFAFSVLMAVISLLDVEKLVSDFEVNGVILTELQAILFPVFIFIIPAIISVLLAQSLFRKRLLNWVKEIQPVEEMEIQKYYEEENEEIEDEEDEE